MGPYQYAIKHLYSDKAFQLQELSVNLKFKIKIKLHNILTRAVKAIPLSH